MKLLAQLGAYDPYSRSVSVIASTSNFVDGWLFENNEMIPIKEALVSWDITRFLKNPIILWAHDQTQLPVGGASEVEPTPEGLRMRIALASEKANPLTEQLAASIQEQLIRAVSVGFNAGPPIKDEVINGVRHITRANNELLEVSFVPVPADEDAGTPAINPDAALSDEERQRKRVSSAASELAKARARARTQAAKVAAERTDADDTVLRLDTSRLGKLQRTGSGGARIPARLTRTGVLVYRNANGSTRRELRLPEEVFRADSLATLADVPVIDIRDHTGLVTPETWKKAALGHAREARRDGDFVASELVVNDAAALDAVDRGERTEISCGYRCRIDKTSGVYQGQPYDVVQRDITYNHVALCPPNRGRAGPDVGLRLDSNTGGPAWGVSHTEEDPMTFKLRFDGHDIELGSEADVAKIDAIKTAAAGAIQTKLDAASAELATVTKAKADAEKARDEAQGRLDASERAKAKAEEDAVKAKKEADDAADEEKKEERKRSLRLIRSLVRGLRVKGLRMTDEEEDKMDAKVDEWLSLGDGAERAIMLDAIRTDTKDFDDKGKSDDYVRARFDSTFENAKARRSIHGVTSEIVRQQARNDATDPGDEHPVAKARKARDAWAANAHKSGT